MRHRARLKDTVFIGVTGSAGKTMTKDLIGTVLQSSFQCSFTRGTLNYAHSVARSIRLARPGDRFHVVELSAGGPGALERPLTLLRPRDGVVTNIGTDHYAAYGSVDAIATEKGRLIRTLPDDGIAVLNADDPRVLAMKDGFAGRVITYGMASAAMVRAENVRSVWPETLSFDLVHGGERETVKTQLYGSQWTSAALAAAAVGITAGLSMQTVARALAKVVPFQARMSSVDLPNGVTCIRDDWKASVHTIPPALEFLQAAEAKRKVAVIGTIADTMGDAGSIYVNTARRALEAADTVCFVGPRAFAALRAAPSDRPERLRAFATAKGANDFLNGYLQPGDLLLLKGSNVADHLFRLALSRMQPVTCWRTDCNRQAFCNTCELVNVPSDAAGAIEPCVSSRDAIAVDDTAATSAEIYEQVLIGLGNPDDRYRDTPHNVGHRMLERIADVLSAAWRKQSEATVASVVWNGKALLLVKPNAWMNHSGREIFRLSERIGFRPDQCILIYDDLDLPIGKVRTRMRGSDGGHRGVRSILEAFQTDQFRRVKVGVRRAQDAAAAKALVLQPFDADDRAIIEGAFDSVLEGLRALIGVASSSTKEMPPSSRGREVSADQE